MSGELRILIIEDSPPDAELAAAELRRAGFAFTVRREETQAGFLAALEEFKPEVILSDYAMPSFDGLAALRLAKIHAPGVPFIVYTGSINEETAVECMKAGAWDYVLKDRLSRLPLAVRGALELAQTRAERSRAERALRGSEALTRSIMDSLASSIAVLAPSGEILAVNRAWREFATSNGGSEATVAGVGLNYFTYTRNALPDGFAARALSGMTAVLHGESPAFALEYPCHTPGCDRWFLLHVTPQVGGGSGLVVAHLEITDRKRIEAQLRQWADAFEHCAHGIALGVPATNRILTCNPAFARMLDRSVEDISGMPILAAYDPADHERIRAHIAEADRTGQVRYEALMCRLDGSTLPVQMDVISVRSADGGLLYRVATAQDIGERVKAEQARRESEERHRLVLANSLDAHLLSSPDGRVLSANAAACRIFGRTEEGICRRGSQGILDARDPRLAPALEERTRTGRFAGQLTGLRADGTPFPVEVSSSVFTEPNGKVLTSISIRDITERAKAERELERRIEELRVSEERYRLIAENTADVIWTLDPVRERFTYVSPSVGRLRGWTAEEVMARPAEEAFMPGSWALVRDGMTARLAALAAGDESARTTVWEIEQPRRDGGVVPTEVVATILTDPDGRVSGILGITRDIRERRRASETQRRLATAVEQGGEGVVITDLTGAIEYVNPAFTRITGYSVDEAIGQNPRILNSGRQDRTFYEDMWTTIGAGGIWSGRLINRRKDGSLYQEETTISPVRDQNGTIVNFVAVKRDVTREMELQEQLVHAQKMEAVGQLAGGIAHDFNNLLQAMLSQVTILRRKVSDEGAVRSVDELEQLVRRGAAMPRQLLLFSRQETAVAERLDLNEVVRGAATLLRRVIRENVGMEVDLSGLAVPVLADHGQLDQVMMNLVVNASDAMPSGGVVTLRTGADASSCWLSVGDNGPGIPDGISARMFEPFFTTKGPGKGTGLGLSVVHGIVTAHRGRIEFASSEGQGSTFTIFLPRAGGEPETRVAGSAVAGEVMAGRGERVLLVEDEESARESLAEILGILGYVVTAVRSGEDAGALPADRSFALLLTDLLLPGITGIELATGLKQRWPDLKVVLMSGYAEDVTARGLAARGLVGFLQKPFDMETLAATVRRALDGPDTHSGG